MLFNEFKDQIIKEFNMRSEVIGEVKENHVLKNNGEEKNGIIINMEESNVSPCIYLENYYKESISGEDIAGIVDMILIQIKQDAPKQLDIKQLCDWEYVRSRVRCKIVNSEKNAKYMEDKPHRELLNLSIVYFIELNDVFAPNENGVSGTAAICNAHMNSWGVDEEIIYQESIKNLQGSTTFRSMESVMAAMCGADEDITDDLQSGSNMYILSNQKKIFGASGLLDVDMLGRITNKFKQDFYVLPSSIHELILIPYDKVYDAKELKAMVQEVNTDQVEADEVLSDSVYYLNAETCEVSIVA